jgi:hypothetical protein
MFSRRTLQSILDQLGESLSEADHVEIVGRMNNPRERLGATWEVAILYGLSRIGEIACHVPLPSGRKPDVVLRASGSSEIYFVADITAISDADHHKNNPINGLVSDFSRQIEKAGLKPSHFHFDVDSQIVSNKIRLRLPKRAANVAMFKKHVMPFLRQIKVSGRPDGEVKIDQPDLSITISYNRRQRYPTGGPTWGHRVYTQARSIEKNSLWKRLNDKSDQLRSAEGVPTGVIVCDGGCSILSSSMHDIGSFSADDIIRTFLRKRTSFDFVCTITSRRGYTRDSGCNFHSQVWTRNPQAKPPIEAVMRAMLANLSAPIFDSKNAATQAEHNGYNGGSRASMEFDLGPTYTRVSARYLLEVLAGKYSPAEIDLVIGGLPLDTVAGVPNPFKTALAKGRLITAVEIEPVDGSDDDQITIRFRGPDPAVSPYRVKR